MKDFNLGPFIYKTLIAFFIILGLRECQLADANDGVGLGFQTIQEPNRSRYGLSIGDLSFFKQSLDNMGLVRYGFGYSNLSIGNGLGLSIKANTGTSVFYRKMDDVIAPQVGFDFGTTAFRLDTNANDYYRWQPGFSVGPQFKIGSVKTLIVAKGGGYVGNDGKTGILPRFRLSHGVGFYINSPKTQIGMDMKWFLGMKAYDAAIIHEFSPNFRLGFEAEKLDNNYSGAVIIKSDLIP